MQIQNTFISGVYTVHPRIFEDSRGAFFESFNQQKWVAQAPECAALNFVQDNHSFSKKGVLRGLHYQNPHPQGKLVRVIKGAIFDVAVDIRRDSNTYGQYFSIELTAANQTQLWIPPGMAHGFLALEDSEVLYKTTDYWHANSDHTLKWDDARIDIQWPFVAHGIDQPIISDKDLQGHAFADIKV